MTAIDLNDVIPHNKTVNSTLIRINHVDYLLAATFSLLCTIMMLIWFTLQCYKHAVEALKCITSRNGHLRR